jgi:hypothetical protein
MPNVMNNFRKLGSIIYASGGRATLDLQRGDVLTELQFRLRYTVTNGGVAAVTPLKQALSRLIRRIEVVVAGRDTVCSISGATLAAMQSYFDRIVPYGTDAAIPLGIGAVTAYDVVLTLPFTLQHAVRPDDTALDLRGVSQATVAITWGPSDCSDLYGTPNAAAISLVTLDVEGRYVPNAGVDASGKMTPYLVRTFDQADYDVPATSNAFGVTVDNNTGLFMRSLFVETEVAKVGADNVLNVLQLVSGQIVFRQSDAVQIKAENRRLFGFAPTAGDYIFFQPWLRQGTTMINTRDLPAELRFVADVTKQAGTNTFRVTREAVRPLQLV